MSNATEPYRITQLFLSATSQNRPGRCVDGRCWEGVKGVVVHRTASPTQDARAIRNYFNDAPDGRYASSQFVVDSKEILQLMPIGEVAFHTAGKNYTHLGIETCEHNWGSTQWVETYRKLVWLVGYLMRSHNLRISDVTGHYAWDPIDRPYDPAAPSWKPGDIRATGLFNWNQFIVDLSKEVERASVTPVTIQVISPDRQVSACTSGRLIESTTYVPLRAYTRCLMPEATVEWDNDKQEVTVRLPANSGDGAT